MILFIGDSSTDRSMSKYGWLMHDVGFIYWLLLHLFKWSRVWTLFLVTKKQFKSACPPNRPHLFHGHPFLRMDEDATASMGTAINLLWCRTVLISLQVMNILQAALMGVSRRGKARLPIVLWVSSKGWLQRVPRRHGTRGHGRAEVCFFLFFEDFLVVCCCLGGQAHKQFFPMDSIYERYVASFCIHKCNKNDVFPNSTPKENLYGVCPTKWSGFFYLPGGAIGYPAQPRLIRLSVCPSVSGISFNFFAGNGPGPKDLFNKYVKIGNWRGIVS